jgi:SAM-dependent methyltransferase
MVAGSYYYFPDQVGFMKNLGKALKPGGLVAVVDLDKDRVSDFRKSKDRPLQVKTKSEISDEMTSAGYVLRESYDFLEHRFFMIFSLAPEAGK